MTQGDRTVGRAPRTVELRDLRAFVAAAQEPHVARGATRRHISPSSMTELIRRLGSPPGRGAPFAASTGASAHLDVGHSVGVPDPRFVVQLHAARRLHYDVRLEVDGVMASWAVPKGPCYDPAVRRLAVHVDDHELSHRHFEGPTGGGRGVIIWDEGTFRNESAEDGAPLDLRAAIDAGHVTVTLDGVKLHGGWHLVRTAPGSYGRDSWLLIKRRDDEAAVGRDVEAEEPASVRSGRTLAQITRDG